LASVRRSRRDGAIDLLFLTPVLALLLGLLAYPFLSGIAMSLHSARGFELTDWVGLDNYARAVFGDAIFHRSLANTVVFAVAAVALQIGIGLLLAVIVADARRGGTLLLLVFTAPFVLASVAVGAVWKFLYAPFFGVAPTVGAALGLDTATIAPLADTDTALWAILAAFVWRFAGFTMVVYLGGIRGISRDYYDFAVVEGAGPWRRLRHITWPLLWPQTFALVVLGTIGALRVFDMVWIMTAGGPSHATETVATHVYSTAFRVLDVGYAQAMAMLLLLVIAVLTVVEYRLLNRRAEMATQ
jgi:raffinose/stachyose/melibiose transport system permease protein